jgi:hypothetical protein
MLLKIHVLAALLVLATVGTTFAAPVTVSADVVARDAFSTTLLWRFDLADQWYVYGPFRNDAGFPPSVELTLPDGWRAGPLRWPAPERHLLEGGILDHVYRDGLTLVQTLHRPAPRAAAAPPAATAVVRWLACRTACVPGDTTMTVDLAASPRDGLADAMTALPGPLPDGAVQIRRRPGAVEIAAPGAAALTVIPGEDAPLLLDLAADGHTGGDRLSLRLLDGAAVPPPFRVLLIIDHKPGKTLGYITL